MMTKDDYRETFVDYFDIPPRQFTGKIEETQEGHRYGYALLWWSI
jgi:hypothetical protein